MHAETAGGIPDRFIEPSASGASWHANLLRFERRKCVLVTHDETLYSVFVPGLRKPELEQLDEVFGQRLFKALMWDEFSQTQIERMLEACREIRFTRSSNRSVLGSMNDMRFQIGGHVEHDGGLTSVDLAQLHYALNRVNKRMMRFMMRVSKSWSCSAVGRARRTSPSATPQARRRPLASLKHGKSQVVCE